VRWFEIGGVPQAYPSTNSQTRGISPVRHSSVFRITYEGPCISCFSLSRVLLTVSIDTKIDRPTEDVFKRMKNKKLTETPYARARWLLQFCQRDLSELTAQALEQLQNEWVEFQGNKWTGNHPPVQNRLVQWQQEVRGKLEELKIGQPWALDCGLWRQLEFVNGQFSTQQRTYPLPSGDENRYLIKVMDTLEVVSNDLMLCAREKCRAIFVRTMRQAYCSARCRGTEGKRRYRTRMLQ
jgi:hypothetical protein